ncbi:MAG: hypothetical protein EOP39_26015 [Rubrivivax sp.]|nr:MAG: hypothetical protein EOP39_26015 [Rubrivivax sp.]
MKTLHDSEADVLRITLSLGAGSGAPPEVLEAEKIRLFRAPDGSIEQLEFADAQARGLLPVVTLGERISARQGWDALRELWREYSWPTKTATLLLMGAALLSIFKPFDCAVPALCMPAPLLESLSSDGMLTLLTLTVAFCIGIHIKLRQEKGLVDGAEHYSIGRALAYGYFSNFIIGVLLTLRADSDRLGLQRGQGLKMHVIIPRSIGDLEAFRESIEKNVRLQSESRDMHDLGNVERKLFKRSLLALTRVGAESESNAETFYLDFPTTLYTMQDFLQTWNLWLSDAGRTPLPDDEVRRLQQKYIADFFAHLKDLANSELGVEAARRLGAKLQQKQLFDLFNEHISIIEPEELLALLAARQAQGGATPGSP